MPQVDADAAQATTMNADRRIVRLLSPGGAAHPRRPLPGTRPGRVGTG